MQSNADFPAMQRRASVGNLRCSEILTDKRSFAPQDVPNSATVDGMCELFERHKIPSAFIAEGLQSVSQSFAARSGLDATYIWFHFLCKDIAMLDGQIVHIPGPGVGEDGQHRVHLQDRSQKQENFTWLKPGFVLRIQHRPSSPPLPSRTTTSSSESTLLPTTVQPEVEMFCFGTPVTLRDRFRKLKTTASCDDLMQDPYILLEIVLEEMYKVMDRTGWTISDIFGRIEKVHVWCDLSGALSDACVENAGDVKDSWPIDEGAAEFPRTAQPRETHHILTRELRSGSRYTGRSTRSP